MNSREKRMENFKKFFIVQVWVEFLTLVEKYVEKQKSRCDEFPLQSASSFISKEIWDKVLKLSGRTRYY